MKKTKHSPLILVVIATILFVVMTALVLGSANQFAYATDPSNSGENQENSTRGIYTSLSISINGGNGKVWTTVRNDVTIFPSTVVVIVELYSSETFQQSYETMTLEQKVQIGDLNLGKTITAEASTGGKQKYWQGRTRYKIDNGNWKEMRTGISIYSADGTYLGAA